jgi:hypothetical protein
MSNKVQKLKELKELFDQGLVTQDEYDVLRREVLYERAAPSLGNQGTPFSLPPEPLASETFFKNPVTGTVVRLSRVGAWWCTFIFGCFYLAYKEAWLHAGIALVLMLIIGPLAWLGWFVYAFFAYRIIVDTYRRKGWVEVSRAEVYGSQPVSAAVN